jgi:hypothetical protein
MTRRLTDAELAEDARQWDERERSPRDWADAPEAVARASEAVEVSLRLPGRMVGLLEEFARRDGVSLGVLIKRWLDARLGSEAAKRRAGANAPTE